MPVQYSRGAFVKNQNKKKPVIRQAENQLVAGAGIEPATGGL